MKRRRSTSIEELVDAQARVEAAILLIMQESTRQL